MIRRALLDAQDDNRSKYECYSPKSWSFSGCGMFMARYRWSSKHSTHKLDRDLYSKYAGIIGWKSRMQLAASTMFKFKFKRRNGGGGARSLS